MLSEPVPFLSSEVRNRGTLRGNEWAWPVADIPAVIEGVRTANLISLGGQLQVRIPHGGTCELYWIDVDPLKAIPRDLPWRDKVDETATIALFQFYDLQERFNFLEEAQSAFGQYLDEMRAVAINPADALCFVWYWQAQSENT